MTAFARHTWEKDIIFLSHDSFLFDAFTRMVCVPLVKYLFNLLSSASSSQTTELESVWNNSQSFLSHLGRWLCTAHCNPQIPLNGGLQQTSLLSRVLLIVDQRIPLHPSLPILSFTDPPSRQLVPFSHCYSSKLSRLPHLTQPIVCKIAFFRNVTSYMYSVGVFP